MEFSAEGMALADSFDAVCVLKELSGWSWCRVPVRRPRGESLRLGPASKAYRAGR